MDVQDGRDRAHRVRRERDDSLRRSTHGIAFTAQHRLHHDRRQEPEGRETHSDEQWERPLDADLGQFVGRQRAQVPGKPEQRRGQQQRVVAGTSARHPTGAHDHHQQHRVQRDAGAQADQVE
jgi:hypothetical protein